MNEPTKTVTLVGRSNCGGSDEDWENCICSHERGGCQVTPGPLPKGGANVAVPPTGEYLVRNGKVRRVIETTLYDADADDEYVAWTVYTDPDDEDDHA